MSIWRLLFRRKKGAVFSPLPDITHEMPERPYLVLQADQRFFADPNCKIEVADARLVTLRCEDPRQKHKTIENMPTRKNYQEGQLVTWEIYNKKVWEACWYRSPETGKIEKAWSHAVEFTGKVIVAGRAETRKSDTDGSVARAG